MFQANRRRHVSPAPLLQPRLEALEDRAVPAIIAGCVYADLNSNGLRDAGETPIANSAIELHNATGAVIGTTITDGDGMYQFSIDQSVDTTPTTKVQEITFDPAPTDLTRSGTVQQFDPTLGQLTSVEIISEGALSYQAQLENLDSIAQDMHAEFNGTISLQGPGGISLTSSTTDQQDVNVAAFDGQADLSGTSARDLGVRNVAVDPKTLTLNSGTTDLSAFVGNGTVSLSQSADATSSASGPGNLLAMIRTMASGKARVVYHYAPSNALRPGQYTIVQSNQPAGYIDGLETSGNQTPIPGSNHSDSITVNLTTNADSRDNCFGELPPAQVGGTVYQDALGAGSWMPGNTPLGNVAITLQGTTVFGEAVNQSTTTAGDGSYHFADLVAGSYQILEGQPGGYLQGTNTVGSLGGSVSLDTFSVNIPTGGVGTGYDFGELLPATPPPPPLTTPPPTTPPPITTPPPMTTPPPASPLPAMGLLPIKLVLSGGGWGGWSW